MATKSKAGKKSCNSQSKVVNKPANNPSKRPGGGAKTKPLTTKSIQFSYYAPEAQQVSLVGDFNSWNTNSCNLSKSGTGEWSAPLSLKPGAYDYKFFVDGEWREDPNSKQRVQNTYGSQNDRIVVK